MAKNKLGNNFNDSIKFSSIGELFLHARISFLRKECSSMMVLTQHCTNTQSRGICFLNKWPREVGESKNRAE